MRSTSSLRMSSSSWKICSSDCSKASQPFRNSTVASWIGAHVEFDLLEADIKDTVPAAIYCMSQIIWPDVRPQRDLCALRSRGRQQNSRSDLAEEQTADFPPSAERSLVVATGPAGKTASIPATRRAAYVPGPARRVLRMGTSGHTTQERPSGGPAPLLVACYIGQR